MNRWAGILVPGLVLGASGLWATLRLPGGATPPATFCDIRILHRQETLDSPETCRDDSHWRLRGAERDLNSPSELRRFLRAEADQHRRHVEIRGDEAAPWGFVQSIMNGCAQEGLAKIDWISGATRIEAGLPIRNPDRVVLVQIRIHLKRDPVRNLTRCKVGERGEMESDDDLRTVVLKLREDYGKAGVRQFPLVIDAFPDVPWRDVVKVFRLFREEFGDIEFTAPLREKARRDR